MKYAWLALGIFAARFLATAIAYPELDGDLAWQRRLGEAILATRTIPRALGRETFTAMGAPWLPQEWAFSLAAALAANAWAWTAFAGCVALAAIAALALAASSAEKRGASARANLVCTSLAGIALFASFGVRAQVVAWPLLALFLRLVDCDEPIAYAAIVVAALWSNVHASALLAPILAGASAFGTALDEGVGSPNVRRRATIAVACLGAVCCNPFGVGLPLYAIGLFTAPFKAAISEWKPTDLGDSSFAYGALPLLVIVVLFSAGPTARRARDAIVLVAFTYLLFAATRNVALFGIAVVPYAAAALTRNVPFFARAPGAARDTRATRFGLPAIAAVLATVVAVGLLHAESRQADNVAAGAIASVVRSPGEHHVLCADFAWCGLAVGSAHTRVFLDGRADPYPAAVWNDYLAIVRLHRGWATTLRRRGVDVVVVAKASGFDRVLARTPGWRRTYGDARYRVWRRASEAAPGDARTRIASDR